MFFLCISRAQTMHLERQSLKSTILFILLLLLLLHSFSHSRISSRPHIIQNRADRTASVWFVPLAWFPSSWKYFTINFVTWCLRGRIIGKRASWDKNSAYLSWLSHLSWPSSSNRGRKASNLLFFGSSFRSWRAKYSLGKASRWALLITWTSVFSISLGFNSPFFSRAASTVIHETTDPRVNSPESFPTWEMFGI